VLELISTDNTSNGVGETIIVVALELNLAAIAVNLPAIRAIVVKRSNARREATLPNGGYGTSKSETKTSQSMNRLDTSRPRQVYEMSQLSNPLSDSPLLDNQDELWRTIEDANGDAPYRRRRY
jgi:hypothetical protein